MNVDYVERTLDDYVKEIKASYNRNAKKYPYVFRRVLSRALNNSIRFSFYTYKGFYQNCKVQ